MKNDVIIIGTVGCERYSFDMYFGGNKVYNVITFASEQVLGINLGTYSTIGQYPREI